MKLPCHQWSVNNLIKLLGVLTLSLSQSHKLQSEWTLRWIKSAANVNCLIYVKPQANRKLKNDENRKESLENVLGPEMHGVSSRRLQSYHLFKISRFFAACCCWYFALLHSLFGRSFDVFFHAQIAFDRALSFTAGLLHISTVLRTIVAHMVAHTNFDCYRMSGSCFAAISGILIGTTCIVNKFLVHLAISICTHDTMSQPDTAIGEFEWINK